MGDHPDITDLLALAVGEIAASTGRHPGPVLQGVLRSLMLEAMDRAAVAAAAAVYDAPTQPDIAPLQVPTSTFGPKK